MAHPHDHSHAHDHPSPQGPGTMGRLWTVLGLTVAFMGVELGYGLFTGSLALISDAGHMLTDAASLALSLGALAVAGLAPTSRRTYGWLRLESLAALLNALGLLVLGAWVIAEALGRLQDPQPLPGGPMMVIAVLGLAINLIGMWLLHRDSTSSLNIRGAFLHVAGDAIGSVGVLIAGYLIAAHQLYWADPAISLGISLLLLYSGGRLAVEATHVLMEAVPHHLDFHAIRTAMEAVPGVREVHDLHIWAVASGHPVLTAHVGIDAEADNNVVLMEQLQLLHTEFDLDHVTLQVERLHCQGAVCEAPLPQRATPQAAE